MNESFTSALIGEVVRRNSVKPGVRSTKKAWRFIRDLHEMQQKFRNDPSRRKIARTSRRAGKSTVAAAMLLEAAGDNPNSLCAYVGLTRKSAKRIMWIELKRFNEKYSLGMVFNETELVATLRNGAAIFIAAANHETDIDRLRGSPYVLVVIDEAGAFGKHLEILTDDVLEMSMMDMDGTIIMIGTPNANCSGHFYNADTKATDPATGKVIAPGWSSHHWTVLDNPHIPDKKVRRPGMMNAADWLADYRQRKGYTESDPKYQRECLGLWTPSSDDIVFKFRADRNLFTEIPKGSYDWQYGVSVDLGYDDPTAIGLFQWCSELPNLYVPWMMVKEGMIPATIAAWIKRLQKKHDLAWVVVDQGGGAGKIVTEEFIQRYGIAAKGAEKQKKRTYIEFLNGDLQSGRVKLHAEHCEPLIDELKTIQWDPEKPGREDQRFKNDCADMLLYGYREAYHYFYDVDGEKDPDAHEDILESKQAEIARRAEFGEEIEMEKQVMQMEQSKDRKSWWEP